MTILHELTHTLGFALNFFEKYHPPESTEVYKDPVCKLTKYKKNYLFLVTPNAHVYAKKRFGVETFIGDNGTSCPAGIEMEDGGSIGTAGSHLEARTYNSENMIGTDIGYPVPFLRFTDATLAVLMDTGNYKINWANAKPLVYGHPESIDGKPISNFAIDPPQFHFPSNYLMTTQDFTGFDYRHYGSGEEFDIVSNIPCDNEFYSPYCNAMDSFYNPKKETYIGSSIFVDLQLLPKPSQVCEEGKAILPGAKI
ncbi:GP63-like [Trichomonas vaginalis G3]|uniref:GP63-like n=1 Tax=Trichomonas vaginalis (strain ATCC PRA-98 / G3) TaxID=412133 RepID=A2DH72_TRIV3|nr:regulation of choline O-acetyltransferase protein [Trichomonas vaginalis G3]EAY20145.1 GP63-like [Trichomonas vaginalis G3]KAI5507612.1 regulation of choline O-acetyltransferase protein [Trichomonas vaginalis G3]|eukprot:XP_001581131.1 GP63-like [Trichomonas vaginalis G3]